MRGAKPKKVSEDAFKLVTLAKGCAGMRLTVQPKDQEELHGQVMATLLDQVHGWRDKAAH